MQDKDIDAFEDKLNRLFHVGEPTEWIALCDSTHKITLLCELIRAKDHDYMNEKYGWNIPEKLSSKPKHTLLLIIQNEPRELLHVFQRGSQFSPSMIPELKRFYDVSDYTNINGAKLLFGKFPISGRVIFFLFAIMIGLIAFTYIV